MERIAGIEWRRSASLVPYGEALAEMETRAGMIRTGAAAEQVWLLEHPPLYTAGTSASDEELLDPRFPVHRAGRGGRLTYHGPGQRVGYVMLDLERRGRDLRRFIHALEGWLIAALARLGVAARRVDGRVGIWVDGDGAREAKIGAIGVRVRRWVSFHGFSINVAPDLAHFGGIVPCGLPDFPVTSLSALGVRAGLADLDQALAAELPRFLDRLGRSQHGS